MPFVEVLFRSIHLQKLHDLCTRELAMRFGGSKTGLLNASMVSRRYDILANANLFPLESKSNTYVT